MAAGACKLIGKMVVKVNLVGSQVSSSRLAQMAARVHGTDSRQREREYEIRGRQEPKWGET